MNVFLQNQEVRSESQRRKRVMRILKHVQQICQVVFAWLMGIALIYGAYVMLFDQNFFTVTKIAVEGELRHLNADAVRALVKVPEGSNLFRVSMDEVQQQIATNPWVAEVAVRRKLPNTLWIYVTEREPVAIVAGDSLHYVDAKGAMFPAGDDVLEDLPILSGLADSSSADVMQALDLVTHYHRYPVSGDVGLSEVHRDPSQGFSIVGNAQPVMIRLGWNDFESKLERFSALWPTIRGTRALPDYVDTNVPGKVIAKYDN